MSARSASPARGVLRLVALAAVLIGVLAMHGLTSDHHVAMTMATPSISEAGGPFAPHAMAALPSGLPEAMPQAEAGHAMAGVCLAILAGLSLLALLALARLATRRIGSARLAPGVGRAVLTGRSPPGNSAEATLSKLCVLRI